MQPKIQMHYNSILKLSIIFIAILSGVSCSSQKEKQGPRPFAITVFSVGKNEKSSDLQNWKKLKTKEKVFKNDWAQTGKASKLNLELRTKTTVSLKPETRIKIESLDAQKNVVLRMGKGVIDNKVKPGSGKKYLVKCVTMNLSVRGTRFIVESDGKTDKVKVIKGKVAISRNIKGIKSPETILKAGQEAKVSVEENAEIAYKMKKTSSYKHNKLLKITPVQKPKKKRKPKPKKRRQASTDDKDEDEESKSKSRNRTVY